MYHILRVVLMLRDQSSDMVRIVRGFRFSLTRGVRRLPNTHPPHCAVLPEVTRRASTYSLFQFGLFSYLTAILSSSPTQRYTCGVACLDLRPHQSPGSRITAADKRQRRHPLPSTNRLPSSTLNFPTPPASRFGHSTRAEPALHLEASGRPELPAIELRHVSGKPPGRHRAPAAAIGPQDR